MQIKPKIPYLSLQKGSPRRQYLAVSVGNTNVSYSEGQTLCEQVGAGLATVLTDADYVALNTTAHQRGAPHHCGRVHMGATSSGNSNWVWRTGALLSTSWNYWHPGEPSRTEIACMRAIVQQDVPVTFTDFTCENTGIKCVLCDA